MAANTVKAIRLHEFGGPEVLRYEDVPLPKFKSGEVLVRVHAIGINLPDWYCAAGISSFPPSSGRRQP
jgi:NADPH:quinone reductase-like Zn-dependent oxidoreductase